MGEGGEGRARAPLAAGRGRRWRPVASLCSGEGEAPGWEGRPREGVGVTAVDRGTVRRGPGDSGERAGGQ